MSIHSGLTCRSTSGLTEISPLNGRSWLAISSTDTATPVAKIPIATAAAARLSLWTMAIAISVQPACANRQAHLIQFTARVQCIFERRHDFTLRRDLPFALGRQRKGQLQCFGQRRRSEPQGSRLFRHRGPLSGNGFVNMAADQVANLYFRLSRKAGGQQYHHADCACLA